MFVLQGGEAHEGNTASFVRQVLRVAGDGGGVAIEANHRMLIGRLDKPERKLVLRIIDDKDRIAGELSLDSIICGFKLAWRLANELDNYNDRRSTLAEIVGLGACSAS